MGFFDVLFGKQDNTALKEMIDNGAVIIDVRTPSEFQGGHVAGAKNIPLQQFENRLNEILNIKKPIVLCCASGNRSGQAFHILQQKRNDCINGGTWLQVNALV